MNSFDDRRASSLGRYFRIKLDITMVIDRLPFSSFLCPDPSAVFDIRVVNVTTTDMQLQWRNTDNATGYIYSVEIWSEHGSDLKNSSHTGITFHGLTLAPYTITVTPSMNLVQGWPTPLWAKYTRECFRTPS